MTTLKCLRCENTITGNYLNNLVLAENTSGWVAWLNGSCTSVGLCPEHSPPMIAAVELLRSATGGEGPAKAVVISTFVKGPVPSNARSTISVRVSSTATCELCGEVWTSDNCADPVAEAAKCAAQGEPTSP
mgnify:CR=1 FL=1